ncbi:MAG: ribonuclease [Patescibacteria group bacterium]|jgi:ribonuclease-3|nr:ribonuclease [Patescibacteria group bacterium]
MIPTFSDSALLETALTHRSALNEKQSRATESNERLEFLGDAVLELATTRFLYAKFPVESEGVLTSYRSALVKTTSLASVATELGLGQQLKMSKGEEATGGRENPGLLADTFEAVLGALYLDQGFEKAEEFLHKTLFIHLDQILTDGSYKDAKSELQERVQALGFSTPDYEVIEEVGPDHDKTFTITVSVGNKVVGQGTGRSKQQAQQAAAENALKLYRST